MRKVVDFGASNCFDLENNIKALAVEEVAPGTAKAQFVALVDPCQAGATPLRTASIQTVGSSVGSSEPGTTGTPLAALCHIAAREVVNPNNTFAYLLDLQSFETHSVSATNTAQTINMDIKGLNQTLSISSVASAGTATLTISASVDNSNFITIDSVAAAGTTVKLYGPTTAGGTTALSPLSFRFVKIVAGTAGVGNTTTIDVGCK